MSIAKTINPGLAEPYGLAWDGSRLWAVDARTNRIYQVNPQTGTAIRNIGPVGGRPRGLTFDGKNLWMVDQYDGSISQVGIGVIVPGMPSLMNNLVAFWNLDEASGVRYDAIGANHLIDNNTVGQAAGVSAQTVNAAQFTAANSEWLSILDNPALSGADIDLTFITWVYLDTKTAYRGIISKYAGPGGREYLLYYNVDNDRFRWVVSGDGTATLTVDANNLGSPQLATWYFIKVWHDSTNNRIGIQVNLGAADTAAHTTGVFDSTTAFMIGSRATSPILMDGRVDATGFWKRLTTVAEDAWLYNGGQGRQYPF